MNHAAGADLSLGFEGRSYTMADYLAWQHRGFCVVCQGDLTWDAEEEDWICACMRDMA